MNKKVEEMLKYLHLPNLSKNWARYLELAQTNDHSFHRLLEEIITEEYNSKKENSRKLRLKKAQMPEELTIETFPWDKQPKLNKKKILHIYDTFDYISQKQNIIWIGSTGTGKSGLASAFLIKAINNGYSGRFILFPDLMEALYKAKADYTEQKLIKQFASYDCLVIDEIGYVEAESVQVGLFFTLMHKRHKQKPTLITSNLGFKEWSAFLKNDHLTAALIDRLTENTHLINMKDCVSLRPKLPSK